MADASILIPVYNEEEVLEENIGKLLDYLAGQELDCEIIVCSNGSTDKTVEIGRRLEQDHSNVFRFFVLDERGVGLAFRKSVAEASTDKIVSVDVDLTTDMAFIPKCVKLLDEYSVVIGSKQMGLQERQFYREFISTVFIYLVKLLLGMGYRDYSIGSKGYRRKDILDYVSGIDHGSSYPIELIYKVKRQGKPVIEVPVYCNDTRRSKFNLVNEILYRLKNLLRLWFCENIA